MPRQQPAHPGGTLAGRTTPIGFCPPAPLCSHNEGSPPSPLLFCPLGLEKQQWACLQEKVQMEDRVQVKGGSPHPVTPLDAITACTGSCSHCSPLHPIDSHGSGGGAAIGSMSAERTRAPVVGKMAAEPASESPPHPGALLWWSLTLLPPSPHRLSWE